jgi:hypothetical protein
VVVVEKVESPPSLRLHSIETGMDGTPPRNPSVLWIVESVQKNNNNIPSLSKEKRLSLFTISSPITHHLILITITPSQAMATQKEYSTTTYIHT